MPNPFTLMGILSLIALAFFLVLGGLSMQTLWSMLGERAKLVVAVVVLILIIVMVVLGYRGLV